MEPKVPLAVKKELRDQEPGLKKGLERLKKITGVEWTLDPNPNYATIYTELDKAGSGAKETMAKSIYGDEKTSYLASFASCLEAKLKDDMIKQAFLRDTPKHKIVFEFSTDENKDKPIEIADGQVTIRTEIRYFGSWMGTYTDFKLETILASDGISTAHLVEIRDSEPKKLKHLAKLKKQQVFIGHSNQLVVGFVFILLLKKQINLNLLLILVLKYKEMIIVTLDQLQH